MRRFLFAPAFDAPGVRTSLSLLVIASILPIALISIFLMVHFYAQERAQLLNNVTSAARGMIGSVDRDIAVTTAALQVLGTSRTLHAGKLAVFHERAINALRDMNAENIALMAPNGQLLLTTARRFGAVLPSLADEPSLMRALEVGGPAVSDLVWGRVSGHFVVAVEVPVKCGANSTCSLNATITPQRFAQVLKDQKLPDTWRAALLDRNGTIVARSHDAEKFVGRKATAGVLRQIGISAEGHVETTTLEGIAVVASHSRSPVNNWTVVVAVPINELSAQLWQTLGWLVAATVAALMIGLALAWFLGGRIARSITALTKPAIALGSGDVLSIPPIAFKEANEMRQALLDAGLTLHQARHAAQHDVLTGLPNRTLLGKVIGEQLQRCAVDGSTLVILYLDLDGFKEINDQHGHAIGDQLLREVGTRISAAVRDADMVARLGGDEFVIVLAHSDMDSAAAFGTRLIEIISTPYRIADIDVEISASIGIASYPSSGSDHATLLKMADQAMYQAKQRGKRQVCVATG
ncbi:diguanylate cyclase (GGDEF)-like protein [Actimicrobium sp. GrIS 1.19]|uniref:sensor domain-containing diguanylate cyclase n=1 Tax=Actimicrobium sp. GrIS 1.19 TaxID=3071708 RepID=UPI002E0BBE5B|nr:diguanylate cyclase (GGDEF)-like protein [Actimicrobium sp. GrIS 1.19]